MKEWRSSQSEAYTTFLEENKSLLSNPIVRSFLQKKVNVHLLKKAIECPTKENKEKVDKAFKKHFFTIRFISYITSSMEYSTINFNVSFNRPWSYWERGICDVIYPSFPIVHLVSNSSTYIRWNWILCREKQTFCYLAWEVTNIKYYRYCIWGFLVYCQLYRKFFYDNFSIL